MFFELLTYAMIGIVSGFLAGLLGMGGGVITVPALFFFLRYFQVEHAHLMHIAIATSLASMIFTTVSSVYSHHRTKRIHWALANEMLLGLAIGCSLGAYVAEKLSTKILSVIFGVFLGMIGMYFVFKRQATAKEELSYQKPSSLISNFLGFIISSTATLLGIGGGLFTVPVLNSFHMNVRSSIATSSAITFFVTLFGSCSYFFIGLHHAFKNHASLGFIYFPAFVTISLFSFVFAPLGVIVMHHLHTTWIKRIFGVVLSLVGVYMIINSF
jgi:uncharacterized membrane protein YfcA